MKLARFRNTEFGYDTVGEPVLEDCEQYMRLSEYVDVEFPPIPPETLVKRQVNALRERKKEIQAVAEAKLTEIDRQIGELLALPAPKEV